MLPAIVVTQLSPHLQQPSEVGRALSPELQYVALLFALFVVPRVLERFRIPAPITALALGALSSLALDLFTGDVTIRVLATLGIVSLFLFAGMEVDFGELRRERRVLIQHLVIAGAVLAGTGRLLSWALGMTGRPAALVALALLTPSTGFILASLPGLDLSEPERFWIKSKAIATELMALVVLFVVLQSTTATRMAISTAVLAALIALVPMVFKFFATRVAPWAPKSEFAFLLMVSVVCAMVTLRLGVYYLVGAFIVGVAARRFRQELPAMASDQMLHAVEVFASVFVPFYFFDAGLHLHREDFAPGAIGLGALLLVVVTPVRVAVVSLHRRLALSEPARHAGRVGIAMLPTLVFTLVIAGILRDQFGVHVSLFGALIVYTLANTLVPGFALPPAAPPGPPVAGDATTPVTTDAPAEAS